MLDHPPSVAGMIAASGSRVSAQKLPCGPELKIGNFSGRSMRRPE
jgi:hypothetical protein